MVIHLIQRYCITTNTPATKCSNISHLSHYKKLNCLNQFAYIFVVYQFILVLWDERYIEKTLSFKPHSQFVMDWFSSKKHTQTVIKTRRLLLCNSCRFNSKGVHPLTQRKSFQFLQRFTNPSKFRPNAIQFQTTPSLDPRTDSVCQTFLAWIWKDL